MDLLAPLAAAALALGITGFGGYQHYGMFECQGTFGRFDYGQLSAMPSQLNFVIDWQMPGIVTDTGISGRITAWTPLQLSFDVQYPTYRASYFINRIDGSISQTSNFGGVFRGVCELRDLQTKF